MKLKLTLLTALAGLGLVSASAQQSADAPPAPKTPPPAAENQPPPPSASRRPERGDSTRNSAEKPMPYIGVLTREVPPEMRSQFSLPDGFGLMVDEVMPDSPAKTAGLKTHDILVKIDDQRLVNMEQLMTLVRSKKKGDSVNLSVITGGKETQLTVTVGERMMPVGDSRQENGRNGFGWPQVQAFNFDFPDRGRRGNGMWGGNLGQQPNGGGAGGGDFAKEMQEYQKRVQEWAKNGMQGPMPQMPQMQMPQMPQMPPMPGGPGQGGGKFQHHEEHHESRNGNSHSSSSSSSSSGGNAQGHAQANGGGNQGGVPNNMHIQIDSSVAAQIVRRDDSGEYTLKRENGLATFTAKPNGGKEQSWPVNTDQERDALPPEMREKLRMFDSMPGGVQFNINGNIAPQPPAPPPGGQAPGKPKGRGTSI